VGSSPTVGSSSVSRPPSPLLCATYLAAGRQTLQTLTNHLQAQLVTGVIKIVVEGWEEVVQE